MRSATASTKEGSKYIQQMKKTYSKIALIIFLIPFTSGCRSCLSNKEPDTVISAQSVMLEMRKAKKEDKVAVAEEKKPRVRRIDIGPSKRRSEEPEAVPEDASESTVKRSIRELALPPETYEETDLTSRLQDKLAEAYGGDEDQLPDVKIYLSEMKYDEFVNYYKDLGYKVQTVAVPAMQVIEPVLEQRPELADKINLADYEDVVIHQVMIDEAGISAADKYIDPDTYEVVNKTFVTRMRR